jgi:hypothetical protein
LLRYYISYWSQQPSLDTSLRISLGVLDLFF